MFYPLWREAITLASPAQNANSFFHFPEECTGGHWAWVPLRGNIAVDFWAQGVFRLVQVQEQTHTVLWE